MPKFVTPMPFVIFRQLKSPGFYPLGGVQGLYLRIRGASESVILRYQDTFGNRRSMSLGLRRSLSLSEARAKATEIRARLSEGITPNAHKHNSSAGKGVAIVFKDLSHRQNFRGGHGFVAEIPSRKQLLGKRPERTLRHVQPSCQTRAASPRRHQHQCDYG